MPHRISKLESAQAKKVTWHKHTIHQAIRRWTIHEWLRYFEILENTLSLESHAYIELVAFELPRMTNRVTIRVTIRVTNRVTIRVNIHVNIT